MTKLELCNVRIKENPYSVSQIIEETEGYDENDSRF
jgi:hypothetical protein